MRLASRDSKTTPPHFSPHQHCGLLLGALLASSFTLSVAHAADSSSNTLPSDPQMLLDDREVARIVGNAESEAMALNVGSRIRSRSDVSNLEVIDVRNTSEGDIQIADRPAFSSKIGGRYASITPQNQVVFYTLDPNLQDYASQLVTSARANHVAIVAMNPKNGAILAIAGKSPTVANPEYHADFPAASLFKIVTAAAAVEEAGIDPNSLVAFRGGTYTLNQFNYLPNPRADRRVMSVGEALGRSCNPVFGQIGIRYLNGSILARYAQRFGFNQNLGFEAPLRSSTAEIPHNDLFELSRTAAGFGEIRLSPIHAAAITSGIANNGLLPKPRIVDRVVTPDGVTVEQSRPEILQRIVQPATAATLMEMMRYTTTVGTSRREFMRGGQPTLGSIEVAGKTGTLSGTNPAGLNNWFVGAAPINNPELAVAVITVDASHSSKASHLARLLMQRFFNVEPGPDLPEPTLVKRNRGGIKRSNPYQRSQQYWARKFKTSAKKGKNPSHKQRKSSKRI